MGKTILEKIIGNHAGCDVEPGQIVDVAIDVRVARDFGGANVVKNLENNNLDIEDPTKTFFTFDCNPGGSDQKYATNQHICRLFARKRGIKIFDINRGIGTHIAIDHGLLVPGGTLVSTDSHANILGAIGAFGQGMGDQDIAAAFAFGRVWFKVPPSIKVILKGKPHKGVTAKDITLALLRHFGANGLLGFSAEVYGPVIDDMSLDGRITIASMATEMGGIIVFLPPNDEVVAYCTRASDVEFTPVHADQDAYYSQVVDIDMSSLEPLISRPGHPEDVVQVQEVKGTKIDSAFIGSCTNGRYEDMKAAAETLRGRKVAQGVVLKIVPSTDRIWMRCLDEGLITLFKEAGALVGNPGCAGCAAGQIGQNGPGEVTVSTGNRNFAGKQGKGDVYLASPATVAASAVAGVIVTADQIPQEVVFFTQPLETAGMEKRPTEAIEPTEIKPARPTEIKGRVWIIRQDNIDTDIIFHNRYLTITDIEQMGQYTFDNLPGWEDFSKKAKPGDIVVTGKNFGAGSSRQQAVDCFKSLGITLIIAESFGAIYERNAINAAMPIMAADLTRTDIESGEEITVDLVSGKIERLSGGKSVNGTPFSDTQMEIYQRGGLLKN
ncbi:MAG: 3-isopropylmalate dehydratase large subunit [Gemmatimonadota bacterium]|nr:MAG: 3-isopropylmalate dehydratase large subunit [Gemmatimonadota bacterium]